MDIITDMAQQIEEQRKFGLDSDRKNWNEQVGILLTEREAVELIGRLTNAKAELSLASSSALLDDATTKEKAASWFDKAVLVLSSMAVEDNLEHDYKLTLRNNLIRMAKDYKEASGT